MIAERIGLHSVLLLLLIAYTLTTRSWKIQIFKFVPMLWFTLLKQMYWFKSAVVMSAALIWFIDAY